MTVQDLTETTVSMFALATLAAIRPSGVDVVSGVEARPGVKSQDRMEAFIEAARTAEESFAPLR